MVKKLVSKMNILEKTFSKKRIYEKLMITKF